MIVFDQAEEKLVSILKTLKTGERGEGCLHIKGGALNTDAFKELPRMIGKWFGDPEEGIIIICEDKDLFVFTRNIDLSLFIKFRERFYDWLQFQLKEESQLVAFYDFRLNGIGLAELADIKLQKKKIRLKEEEEKIKAEAKEKLKKDAFAENLDLQLIRTLASRRASRKNLEILVIEDDPFSCKLIEAALKPDFSASFAHDGQAAILTYIAQAPDIVFVDINLPDTDGHVVLQKILGSDPKAYAVMLSGSSNIQNIQRAIGNGARGFVAKPFTKETLMQHISKCPKYRLEKIGA